MPVRCGLSLDDIELGDQVGSGVSGHVFRAVVRGSGVPLAAKIFSFADADPDFYLRERFHRECRALATLDHPVFPALYGWGESDDGHGFALMEWIAGQPLDAYRSCRVGQMVRMAHIIATGLQRLHEARYLHRDIAFDNILVEEHRFGPYPRLIDLGVAKDLTDPSMTIAGSFLGRLAYAPPEMFSPGGAAALFDPRSDVFSLGVLLHEWIAGQRPFEGDTVPEILKGHRRKDRPPPSLVPERGVADERLLSLVDRLLQLEMEKRPTIDEVVRQLLELRRVHPAARVASSQAARESLVSTDPSLGIVLTPVSFPSLEQPRSLGKVDVDRGILQLDDIFDSKQPELEVAEPPPVSIPPNLLQRVASSPTASNGILVIGIAFFLLTCAGAAWLFLH